MLKLLPTQEQIISFINEFPLAFVATVNDGKPSVRGIMTYKTTAEGIIFTTGKNKEFYQQLKNNPNTELCFYHDEIQIRVNGQVIEMDDDIMLKEEIVASRPFMQPWIEAAGYDILGLFKVVNCKAIVYRTSMPLSRKRIISLTN